MKSNVIMKMKKRLSRIFWKETKFYFFMGGGKTIYIIRRGDRTAGFFSNFFYVLGHIRYAEANGFDFVVDMKHYKTPYSETKKVEGTYNVWEYYFKQMGGISNIRQIFRYRHIVLSNNEYLLPPFEEGKIVLSHEDIEVLSPLVKKYIQPNQAIIRDVLLKVQKLGVNSLGVHIRGTDMKHTYGHAVPADIQQYIDAIDLILEKERITKVYLCTDEARIAELIVFRYGDLIEVSDSWKSSDGTAVHAKNDNKREFHHYLLGREVLIDALVLSKCNHLICGRSNVSGAAILFNDEQYKSVTPIMYKCIYYLSTQE